jgi:hypothetical protein
MTSKKVECPQCLGTHEFMKGNENGKGFKYRECKMCDEDGQVEEEIAEDYLLSLNEDNINNLIKEE